MGKGREGWGVRECQGRTAKRGLRRAAEEVSSYLCNSSCQCLFAQTFLVHNIHTHEAVVLLFCLFTDSLATLGT